MVDDPVRLHVVAQPVCVEPDPPGGGHDRRFVRLAPHRHQRAMKVPVAPLPLRGERGAGGEIRALAEHRQFAAGDAQLRVRLDQLRHRRQHLPAEAAVVVEELGQRDVALRVAEDRRVRAAFQRPPQLVRHGIAAGRRDRRRTQRREPEKRGGTGDRLPAAEREGMRHHGASLARDRRGWKRCAVQRRSRRVTSPREGAKVAGSEAARAWQPAGPEGMT